MKMAYNPFYFFRSILGKKNCFRFQVFLIFAVVGLLYKFVIEPFFGFFQMIFNICYKVLNPVYISTVKFLSKRYEEVKQLDERVQITLGIVSIIVITLICYCIFRFICRKCKCFRCCALRKKKRNIYTAARQN